MSKINKSYQMEAITSNILIENILKSIENNEVYYAKNVFQGYLNWEDFITLLDYQYNNSKISDGNNPDHRIINKAGVVTNIVKYPDFHYHMLEIASSNLVHQKIYEDIVYIKNLMDYFKTVLPSRFILKSLVNFVGNDFIGSMHNDPYHVFSMQHLGNVEYTILDKNGDKKIYILEPGDFIFMPSGTNHSISAPEPRGTLILDIEKFR